MNSAIKIFLLLSVSTLIVACDKDTRRAYTQAPRNVVEEPKLQGTFESTCHSVDLDALHGALDGSQQVRLRFTGGKFTRTNIIFSEEKCASPAIEFTYEGDFKVDAVKGSPAGSIDIRLTKAIVKPMNENAASLLNKVKFCGVNNYQVNKPQEVRGERAACPFETLPQAYYGTYSVQGSELFLDHPSITGMAKSKEDRKTDVKKESQFKKR